MLIKLLISLVFISISLFAANNKTEGAKFLVLDGNTFEMIKNTNILNGGISKRVVVTSKRLKFDDYKMYYPEYFLFKGEKCSILNTIIDTKSNNKVVYNQFTHKNDIIKEIKKLKLMQMLNDDNETKGNYSKLSKKIIKSLSLICNNKLIFRNKVYQNNNYIGKYKITKIDSDNSILYIKE